MYSGITARMVLSPAPVAEEPGQRFLTRILPRAEAPGLELFRLGASAAWMSPCHGSTQFTLMRNATDRLIGWPVTFEQWQESESDLR